MRKTVRILMKHNSTRTHAGHYKRYTLSKYCIERNILQLKISNNIYHLFTEYAYVQYDVKIRRTCKKTQIIAQNSTFNVNFV